MNKPRNKAKVLDLLLSIDTTYIFAALAFGTDQASKYLVEQGLAPYGSGKTLPLAGGLVLRYYRNSGASNNILADMTWLISLFAIAAIIGLIWYYHKSSYRTSWFRTGIGLLLGGALGNLSDRFFKQGLVTDFLHFDWLPFLKTFNLADVAIRSGIGLLVLAMVFRNANVARTGNQPEVPV